MHVRSVLAMVCLLALILTPSMSYAHEDDLPLGNDFLQAKDYLEISDGIMYMNIDEEEFGDFELVELGTFALSQEEIISRQIDIDSALDNLQGARLATSTDVLSRELAESISALLEADLDVRDIESSRGTTFVCRQNVAFTAMIINWGPIGCRAAIKFSINDRILGMGSTSLLAPYTYTLYQASLNINTAELHNVRFDALPLESNISDNYIPNNHLVLPVTTTMDTDLWSGKWANASNLTVNVDSPAAAIMNNNSEFISAIHKWNGISSNVRYSARISDNYDANCYVSVGSKPNPDTVAWTQVFKGNGVPITGDNVLYDGSNYTMAAVYWNNNNWSLPGYSVAIKSETITHEFGHVLGLMHPHDQPTVSGTMCNNPSIMWYETTGPYTPYVSAHDIHNVRAKYGY